ncbi:hypothetical protein WT83_29060 [Burkholderia territorii]|uniref:Preprotein translocase SecA n=1 Tax=Burkholderia territorii TaxID=1503055 RepID=A0A125K3W7_9BURK|nr:hypothetical protein [Burkholderia territorii]KWN05612.1 hypothetical protein WT83_29060 [Burkholderia territorii]
MLSPHEFATLMLIGESPEPDGTELDPNNLATLVEQQLVYLEQRGSGYVRPGLTHDGQSLLLRIRGARQAPC